jgi:hypothetical protein
VRSLRRELLGQAEWSRRSHAVGEAVVNPTR